MKIPMRNGFALLLQACLRSLFPVASVFDHGRSGAETSGWYEVNSIHLDLTDLFENSGGLSGWRLPIGFAFWDFENCGDEVGCRCFLS